ncbi:hypothetical protein C0W96_03815 [Photobacterium kishitanii]|uniref:hypothetical protein n=1 Tax=Photobacterium kishitanii TaxID=318456 RepID=UPI0005D31D08|nr:hypothetical protein [Photobacterium kishitanii]KJG06854.1 membrane protein [Photobacterium kishitanii]PSV08378.1 hypothetical protein C0W96_03815 [Photobacterium kishitanii]PSV74033.1 hypothetical protein C0W29_16865 [Photobacterium kishitanii]
MAKKSDFTDEEYQAFAQLMDSYNRTFAISLTTLILSILGFIVAETQIGYTITDAIRWIFGLLVVLPLTITVIGSKRDFNNLSFSMPKTILYSVLNAVSLITIAALVFNLS